MWATILILFFGVGFVLFIDELITRWEKKHYGPRDSTKDSYFDE